MGKRTDLTSSKSGGGARTRFLGSIAATGAVVLVLLTRFACCEPDVARANPSAAAPAVTLASASDVLRAVKDARSPVVVLNVWATWCEPCRAEFPDLLKVYREFRPRGLKLVLISADFTSQLPQVRSYLARQGVEFETYLKTGSDIAFIDALDPNWSGALPATFVYDRQGRRRAFWEGASTYEDLAARVRETLRDAPGGAN